MPLLSGLTFLALAGLLALSFAMEAMWTNFMASVGAWLTG